MVSHNNSFTSISASLINVKGHLEIRGIVAYNNTILIRFFSIKEIDCV